MDSVEVSYNSRNSGFSLTELLVVIAIVMLLVAMLFPIVLRLKDKANLMKCLNNLRNIGITCHTYATDYSGHIPHRQHWDGVTCVGTPGWQNQAPWPVIRAFFEQQTGVDYGAYDEGGRQTLSDLHADGVMKHLSTFFCPSPQAKQTFSEDMYGAETYTQKHNYMTTYRFRTVNHCGSHGWNGPPGGWTLGTHNPDAWIVQPMLWWNAGWGDILDISGTNIDPGPYDIIYDSGNMICHSHHTGNQYPVLHLDGHVEAFNIPKSMPKKSYGQMSGYYGDWYE